MKTQTFSPDDGQTAILSMIRTNLKDDNVPFLLIIRIRMREGMQRNVDAAFAAAREQTLTEPGAIRFDLNHDAACPDEVVVCEVWRSVRDMELHMGTPQFASLRTAFEAMAAGAPELQILTPAQAPAS